MSQSERAAMRNEAAETTKWLRRSRSRLRRRQRRRREADARSADNGELETITVTGSNIRRGDIIDHYNESTVVQTGAASPAGISASTTCSPGAARCCRRRACAWSSRRRGSCAIAARRAGRVARRADRAPGARKSAGSARASAAVAGGRDAVVGVVDSLRRHARRRFRRRICSTNCARTLIETPACVPSCASIANADVSARGDEIRVALEAHAAARVALPIPADDDALQLRSITRRRRRAGRHRAATKASLHVGLARGVHRVELVYAPRRRQGLAQVSAPADARRVFRRRLAVERRRTTIGCMTETLSLSRARENGTAGRHGHAAVRAIRARHRDITLGLNWTISTRCASSRTERGRLHRVGAGTRRRACFDGGHQERGRIDHRCDRGRRERCRVEQHARQGRHPHVDGAAARRSRRSLAHHGQPDLACRIERRADDAPMPMRTRATTAVSSSIRCRARR